MAVVYTARSLTVKIQCATFCCREIWLRVTLGDLSSFEISLVIQRVQPSGKCSVSRQMPWKDERPQAQLDIDGSNLHYCCKTDCTVVHVLLPAHVPSVDDSFTVMDLQRRNLQNINRNYHHCCSDRLLFLFFFCVKSCFHLSCLTRTQYYLYFSTCRFKDVVFTCSHKEYCPQRACQLISVGYANIPMSADWRINQCLFHHVAFASVTLLGAVFFFFAINILAFMITSHLEFWTCLLVANAVLWVNLLDWCTSRHHDYIFSFSLIHRIFICYPSVVFSCCWKEEILKGWWNADSS